MADDSHLFLCQIGKKKNGFMYGSLTHKVGSIALRFFSFHILLLLVLKAILTGLFLFKIKNL